MKRKGFTLVELFVVISIIAIVTTAGFSLYNVWQDRSSVSGGEAILISALREAQSMALSGKNDSNWGVKYLPGQIVVFSGASYNLRSLGNDRIFTLPRGVAISGLDEFIFIKFSGLPQSALTCSINYGDQTIQINISEQGVLSR